MSTKTQTLPDVVSSTHAELRHETLQDPRTPLAPIETEDSCRCADLSFGEPRTSRAYPELKTERFYLRPFVLADIASLVALAGQHRIADTTVGIPHPYTHEFARTWICSHSADWKAHRGLHWAAVKLEDLQISGYAGLRRIDLHRRQAELLFWVGRGVQRQRDAIEWSSAILDFAWTAVGIDRVFASQLDRHPLAGGVLAAIGMQPEGLVRKRILQGGQVEDIVCWAVRRR